MFHPLITNLKDVSLDDLTSKINELYQKLNQAMRMGNASIANQLRMVLNTYQEEYQRRMAETAEKAKENKMLKDKIKVKK